MIRTLYVYHMRNIAKPSKYTWLIVTLKQMSLQVSHLNPLKLPECNSRAASACLRRSCRPASQGKTYENPHLGVHRWLRLTKVWERVLCLTHGAGSEDLPGNIQNNVFQTARLSSDPNQSIAYLLPPDGMIGMHGWIVLLETSGSWQWDQKGYSLVAQIWSGQPSNA